MLAGNLISNVIPFIQPTTTGDEALLLMEEFKINHLAVLNGSTLVGVISDDEIYDLLDLSEEIGKEKSTFSNYFTSKDAHIYNVLAVMGQFNLSIVPVIDEKERYLGSISIHDLADEMAKLTNAKLPGGILVLEVSTRDYSLAQAAQIVESDNAKILSSYVQTDSDSMIVQLVLKINKVDLSSIISGFLRYNYTIKASFHESRNDEDLQSRYDQFMNYLNM